MKKIIILLILPLISGCSGCLGKLYGVHEEPTPINILIKSNLSKNQLEKRIDSLAKLNYNEACKYGGLIPGEKKIVYLSECAAALVTLKDNLICMTAFCKPTNRDKDWMFFYEAINWNDSLDIHLDLVKTKIQNELNY